MDLASSGVADGSNYGDVAMVTLLDLSDDDRRLFEMFDLLQSDSQAAVLHRISIAACFAVLTRSSASKLATEGKSPDQIAEAFLMRCMPTVPCGYLDDFGFEDAYLDHARPLLASRCVNIVLSGSSLDSRHANALAADLTECAMKIRADFCAPDFDEQGFVGAEAIQRFIEDWRDSFEVNLSRMASAPDKQLL